MFYFHFLCSIFILRLKALETISCFPKITKSLYWKKANCLRPTFKQRKYAVQAKWNSNNKGAIKYSTKKIVQKF